MELNIKIEKKHFLILLFSIILIGGGLFVYASGSTSINPGHESSEIVWDYSINVPYGFNIFERDYSGILFRQYWQEWTSDALPAGDVVTIDHAGSTSQAGDYDTFSIASNGFHFWGDQVCINGDCRTGWPSVGSAGSLICTSVSSGVRRAWYSSAACPSGYTVTGGSCMCIESGGGPGNLFGSYEENNGWTCGCANYGQYPNEDNAWGNQAIARCCKLE